MPSQSPFQVTTSDAALFFGTLLVAFLLNKYRGRKNLPYPPGPRPLPILGNLFDVPLSRYALTWTQLGNQYGPLTWLAFPGQNFLIVNSAETAKELLEKRGSNYQDRPRWVMLREIMELSHLTTFSGYNAQWRRQRAYLKQALSMPVVKRDYSSMLETKARVYLDHCFAHPREVVTSLHRCLGEVIIELTYGRLGNTRDYIERSETIAKVVMKAMQGYVVDLLPFLKYLPAWLPGMGFKRYAAKWKKEIEDTRRTAFETVKETAMSGDPRLQPSYMMNQLKRLHGNEAELNNVKNLEEEEAAIGHSGFTFYLGEYPDCIFRGSRRDSVLTHGNATSGLPILFYLYTAGVESTATSVETLILAMALFPSVQEKAQAELVKIVGQDRLPTFDDQEAMPYLHAVLLETLRWHPIAPGGVPHTSLKDDVYQGYFIPKGTAVIVNSWGISRNPTYYTNPSVFDPERYLKPSPALDPREFAFGHGRRICPGNELAFQAMWILAASILWGFKITIAEDEAAALREDTKRFSLDLLSRPVPFNCQFVPRYENLKGKWGFSAA